MHLGAEGLTQPAMVRVLVVIEDHFLVDLFEPHQSPKNSSARRTPATRRSTSSTVLYTAKEARAVVLDHPVHRGSRRKDTPAEIRARLAASREHHA